MAGRHFLALKMNEIAISKPAKVQKDHQIKDPRIRKT
jgi:hypothetical protein